jgi:diguanylate cyclase (GGDEF)-like protein/PAS domain S-box-containing protein
MKSLARHALISAALDRCAAEVIHRPGSIQPHGCLLATDENLVIRHASENVQDLLGQPVQALLGTPITQWLGPEQTQQLRTLLDMKEAGLCLPLEVQIPLNGGSARFNGQAHHQDGLVVVELEATTLSDRQGLFDDLFMPVRDRLQALESEQQLEPYMAAVAEQVGRMTGIDRVLIYRFDSQWDGEVIAEHRNREVESFLGHHFPAADIPPQARDLYLKNRLRLIADVHANPVAIVPPLHALTGQTIDLSYASLRSFSPVHLEYLHNMGVSASLSVSLVARGRLWGLIACHHYAPFTLPAHLRELADFVGRTVSLKIADIERTELRGRIQRAEHSLERLSRAIEQEQTDQPLGAELEDLIGSSGAIICVNQRKIHIGKTPDLAFVNHLVDWLRTRSSGNPFATDALPEAFALAADGRGMINGLLAVPANADFTNYVLWFRPEITRSVRWAGNPEKVVEADDDGVRISPRKSFGAWVQSYSGRSAQWSFADIDIGQRLSLALMTRIARSHVQGHQVSPTRDLLLTDAKTLVGSLDEQLAYQHISDNVLGILGFQSQELIRHPLIDFVFEEDVGQVTQFLLGVQGGQTTLPSVTFRHGRKDGRYVWIEWEATPATPGSGALPFTARDVTERQKHKASLEELQRRYHRILDAKREGVLIIDPYRQILLASETACQWLGYEGSELRQTDFADLQCDCQGGAKDVLTGQWQAARLRSRIGIEVDVELCGITLPLSVAGSPHQIVLFRMAGHMPAAGSERMDLTSRLGVMVTDRNGRIDTVSEGFTRITGYPLTEAQGRTPSLLRSDVHTHDYYQQFWQSLAAHRQWRGEVWNRRKNGEVYLQASQIFALLAASGEVSHYVALFQDISASQASNEAVHALPEHDALTGLPSRILFERMVAKAMSGNAFAVSFIGLDNFTEVNEALGHISGDRLLYLVGRRLSSRLRVNDRIGRWGGDRFMVFLAGVATEADALSIMQRHMASLAEPFSIAGKTVLLQARVGISLCPRDGRDPDTLMQAADQAQGQARKMGPGAIAVYNPELAAVTAKRFALAHDLRPAIRDGQFFLVYQPQVDAVTGALVGLEALVRWRHPERGIVPPFEFIQVAEEAHLMDELGAEVFRMACAQISAWRSRGRFEIPVGINVSPFQLKPGLAQSMKAIMQAHDVPPRLIEVEITESALQPTPAIRAIVQEIKDLGVSLAIDDFGTGYSSLSHIKLFPFDRLKIDKSFVDGLPQNPDDLAIAQTIVALAKALKVNVLAEGVEHPQQAACLKTEGVQTLQGYFYSRPVPVADLEPLLFGQAQASVIETTAEAP